MSYDFETLLTRVADLNASDMYICAGSKPVALVNGRLESIGEEILSEEDTLSLARQSMSEDGFRDFQKQLEVNLAYRLGEDRFRLNVYFQRNSAAMVARLIRSEILGFEDLGLPAVLGEVVMHKRGIVLVTGATGSGKSTTLAAMIDHRNRNSTGHIVTVEDPIEFVHKHKGNVISQREVGIDTHSFHEALRSVLRQAPNVILIGEIRDAETAKFALHASDTGHLVLSTLHTNNANQTLERILNMFPADGERAMLLQLSLNLRGIISQRLVPTVDGKRVAAIEIMLNSPRVQELIQQKKIQELKSAMAKGINEGMQTFDQALYILIKAGKVDEETGMKYADSANDLKLRLRGIGGSGLS